MKRLILLIIVSIFTGINVNAQCTPDPSYTEPGIYPDIATGFDDACIGNLYEQVVTNIIPSDTSVMVGPFPVTLVVDSIVITNVTGLPPGFTYSCNDTENVSSPADEGTFEGGTTGCILISGTPQAGDEATYDLSIEVDMYTEGGTTPTGSYTIEDYSILVETCSAEINELINSNLKLFPNPVSESFTIEGLAGMNVSEISIINTHGQIFSTHRNIASDSFNMNANELDTGLYFVKIKSDNSIEMIRFIKE